MILDTWKHIVEQLDQEKKCGFCWDFFAPMTEIDLNLVNQKKNCCCVNVFLLRNKTQDFSTNISLTPFQTVGNVVDIENYDVYFLIKSKPGINNYNEKYGHPIAESRHKTIFEPLRHCINHSILSGICGIGLVTSWNGTYIYDYSDEQYYGIKIAITQQMNNYE